MYDIVGRNDQMRPPRLIYRSLMCARVVARELSRLSIFTVMDDGSGCVPGWKELHAPDGGEPADRTACTGADDTYVHERARSGGSSIRRGEGEREAFRERLKKKIAKGGAERVQPDSVIPVTGAAHRWGSVEVTVCMQCSHATQADKLG